MKKSLISLVCALAFTTSYAQQYRTSLGVRVDWSNLDVAYSDLSLKHFMGETSNAFEFTLGFGRSHVWTQIMYERNYPLGHGFEWYWGLGGDIGYWDSNSRVDDRENQGIWSGIDSNIGIEYTFSSFPINIALDVGPTFRVYSFVEVGPLMGFSVRYAFKNR